MRVTNLVQPSLKRLFRDPQVLAQTFLTKEMKQPVHPSLHHLSRDLQVHLDVMIKELIQTFQMLNHQDNLIQMMMIKIVTKTLYSINLSIDHLTMII